MLRVARLVVHLDERKVLDGVDLTVAAGETMAVLGPSGAGKTTLLRAVAGLTEPTGGSISWQGRPLDGTPPHRRKFGLMFQDLALFPNLDVGGNVAFGLQIEGRPAAATRKGVAAALDLVGLAGFEDRAIESLSGGEQQRVALARSLAPRPRLVMLDEPLGSLDRPLRERLAGELSEIFSALEIPVLYVTHDQQEAFAVADTIAILSGGCIEQAGGPEELWRRPRTETVARFLGFTTIVDADLNDGSASTVLGRFPVEGPSGRRRLLVRPDAVHIDEDGPIDARIESVTFSNGAYLLTLRTAAGPVLESSSAERREADQAVRLQLDHAGMVVLAD